MARISITSPEGHRDVDIADHNTLGRHPSNTIQLLDRIVSKEHCHITLMAGRFVLKDLGSLNGTFVNGQRVEGQRALNDGDEIAMGGTRIIFTTAAVAPTPPSGDARTATALPNARGSMPPSRIPPPPGSGAAALPPSRVTMATGQVESHIRTKLSVSGKAFLPEKMVSDVEALRRDYERLRVSHEVARQVGVELDVQKLLAKVLDAAFQLLPADRGVILLVEDGHLVPRAVRTRRSGADGTAEEVILSTTILDTVRREKTAVLSSDASMDSRFQGAHSIIMQGIRSSMAVPLLHGNELFGIMMLDSQIATNAFTEKDLELFQNVANQAAVQIQNSLFALKLEAEAITRQRFQRLLSPAIAEQVLAGNVEIAKGGQLRDTTVLFSDIRGFTAMSERKDAREVVDMLNEYFELMVDIIFEHEGTLDKFVGDEIMALFGAPVSHTDDARRAVLTAIQMMRTLDQFNRARAQAGLEPLFIGIGINSGEVVAGYIGSSLALSYTVIGDVVNTGSRLCSVAKAGEIIISETVYQRVKNDFEVIELPQASVKGKGKPLKIYNVIGERARESQFGNTRPK